MNRPPADLMGSVRGARRHPGRPDRRLQRAALVLIGLGVMSVVAAGALLGYGAWQERQLTKQWDQIMSTIPPTVATAPPAQAMAQSAPPAAPTAVPPAPRSEERRVGKECRSRWAQYQYK